MVLRFGKIIDWTSRNTAIGRISLDDENLYKLCMHVLVVVVFVDFF